MEIARQGTYRHSAYWYAYRYGWTYSEAGTYTGKYLDLHTFRPRMKERPDGEWRGRDWFKWRNSDRMLDSGFNPFMLGACIAMDIGLAMRDEVRRIADATAPDMYIVRISQTAAEYEIFYVSDNRFADGNRFPEFLREMKERSLGKRMTLRHIRHVDGHFVTRSEYFAIRH